MKALTPDVRRPFRLAARGALNKVGSVGAEPVLDKAHQDLDILHAQLRV